MRIATCSVLTLLAACGSPFSSSSEPEVPLELYGPPGTFKTTSNA